MVIKLFNVKLIDDKVIPQYKNNRIFLKLNFSVSTVFK